MPDKKSLDQLRLEKERAELIFSTMATAAPAVDSSVSAVTAVWSYVGELVFNLLILVGAIKGCDRIVKEIMGL